MASSGGTSATRPGGPVPWAQRAAPVRAARLPPPRGEAWAPPAFVTIEGQKGVRGRHTPPRDENCPGGRAGSRLVAVRQITGEGTDGHRRRRHEALRAPSAPPHLHILPLRPGAGQSARAAAVCGRRSPAAAAPAPARWRPAGERRGGGGGGGLLLRGSPAAVTATAARWCVGASPAPRTASAPSTCSTRCVAAALGRGGGRGAGCPPFRGGVCFALWGGEVAELTPA